MGAEDEKALGAISCSQAVTSSTRARGMQDQILLPSRARISKETDLNGTLSKTIRHGFGMFSGKPIGKECRQIHVI